MFRIAIIFTTAILISAVAAYFSIVGLAALFAATFWGVVVMGVSLEAGKVVAATWAHEHWSDPNVSRLHKGYLVGAVGALMLVTSLGIYGYLSKGHLEQAAPMAGTNLQIQQGELRIQQLEADNARLTTRLNQLDQSVNVMLNQDRATQGLRARRQQASERAEINSTMDANNKAIQEIQTSLLPLKTANLEVEAKLGPVKYVAELFGWKDPEVAVRMIILIIMVAFDPLALVLIISGGISLRQLRAQQRLESERFRDEDFQGIMDGLNDAVEMEQERQSEVENSPEETLVDDVVIESQEQNDEIIDQPSNLQRFGLKTDNPIFIPTGFESASTVVDTKSESGWAFIQELEADRESKENQLVVETDVDITEQPPVESENEQYETESSEKEKLLAMLEKNPDVLQDIIEVIETYRKPPSNTVRLSD